MVKNVLQKHGNRPRPRPNPVCPPISLHGPVNRKTTISDLNIWLFFFALYHITNLLCTHIRLYIPYFFASYFARAETFVVFTICVLTLHMVGVV